MACYGRKMDPKENRVPGPPGTSHCVWARITISTYRLPGNTLVPQWLHHLKSGEVLLVKVPILSTPCGCPPRYAPWRWKLLLGVLAQGGSPPNSLGLCDDCCFQCGWYINKNPKLHTRWQPQITVLRWLFVNMNFLRSCGSESHSSSSGFINGSAALSVLPMNESKTINLRSKRHCVPLPQLNMGYLSTTIVKSHFYICSQIWDEIL
jgi:hypothetical protein